MKIKKTGVAGTMESSDIMITLEPNEAAGIDIELKSTVEKRFGREIRKLITETLRGLAIDSARVKAVDKGALDCAIRARVKTAAHRACGADYYEWEGSPR